MPFNAADTQLYRRDVASKGQELSIEERAKLLKPYLPTPRAESPAKDPKRPVRKGHRRRIRPFLKSKFHFLVYFVIQLIFGIYIRLRQIYHATTDRIITIRHYHHRSPEYIQQDVKNLSRIPEHLSVILKFKAEEDGGLEALMDETAELCAWSAAAGIPMLSVYEKSGIMKSYMSAVQELVNQKLASYFGPARPSLRVFAPNYPSLSPSPTPVASPNLEAMNSAASSQSKPPRANLNLLLLSATDGRDTLVDLTRTLTEMAQAQKIQPKDITSDLINAEISATTAVPGSENSDVAETRPSTKEVEAGEPDLVIVFGPYVKLDGYPPWQIRLSEIFCVGDSGGDVRGGSTRVEYQQFLRGLWRYAGAEMRFGR